MPQFDKFEISERSSSTNRRIRKIRSSASFRPVGVCIFSPSLNSFTKK